MKTHWHFSAHPVGILCLLAALLFVPIRQLLAALLAIALHEGAHLLAMRLCRVRHCTIEWTPLGFVAQTDGFSCLPARKRVWIALSGLLASGLLTTVFWFFASADSFCYLFFTANLAILLINALPILPLDGGRVLLSLAAWIGWERNVKKALLFLSYLVAILITSLGLYALWKGIPNPSLLVLGPYLAYAARESSLQGGSETVQMLSQRAHPAYGIYPVESWAVVGPAQSVALMQVLKRTPPEKFVLLHTIHPENGKMIGMETQQQAIVKLLKDT